MDVKKILALVLLAGALEACSKSSNSSTEISKTFAGDNCNNQAISNEKIIRWKNGKVSRHVSQNTSSSENFFKDHADEIEEVEDNYRVSRPVQPVISESEMQKVAVSSGPNWGVEKIRAQDLWDRGITGQGVIVATVDSGIDAQHKQLKNQIYTNPKEIENGIDDDKNGLIDDVHGFDFTENSGTLEDTSGHGTHVAGIIAADHTNGPMRGVAPGAKLIVYDFFGSGDGSVYDAIRALRFAAAMGAKVINASWGGPSCSASLKKVIDELAAQDILFITASGNEHQNIDYVPSYPASYTSPSLISVGAMSEDDLTAGFSNYGSKRVDLVAPGMNIYSTYPKNNYQYDDGTSMATPYVVGAAALLRSAFPGASAVVIKEALVASVKKGPYPVASRGSLDVSAAYDYLVVKFAAPTP